MEGAKQAPADYWHMSCNSHRPMGNHTSCSSSITPFASDTTRGSRVHLSHLCVGAVRLGRAAAVQVVRKPTPETKGDLTVHYASSLSRVIALGLSLLVPTATAFAAEPWVVQPAAQARVVIDPSRTIRPQVPATLYSFNMHYIGFEKEAWDKTRQQPKPAIANQLATMPGSFYRYPEGLMSNHFSWENSVLPLPIRQQKRKSGGGMAQYPFFGLGEYLGMVKNLGGMSWFAVNLVGGGTYKSPIEYPSSTIAASNKQLALYMKNSTPNATVRYYQLGNELDRTWYEWPHSKYVSRARDTINAMLSVDPNARFVAFMREFNWTYKHNQVGTTSTADALFRDVLRGLPMVNDFSLHFYYDGKLSPTSKFITIPDVMSKIQKALGHARDARPGDNFNVWVTEHSKRVYLSGGTPEPTNALDTGLSMGDFLIGVTQMPEVKGAGAQALQGNPRHLFHTPDLMATPAFAALRVLKAQPFPRVVASQTFSPNSSGYPGGYDVRAVGFTDATNSKLAVSAVNRATKFQTLQIQFAPFKDKAVGMKHYYVAGKAGVNPMHIERDYTFQVTPGTTTVRFSSTGTITLTLPPASVSTIVFQ